MPTALDRVQVLLQPDEYAEVTLLAKQERRSLASMSAVLIAEAINARVKAGTFDRDTSDPAYETARKRYEARAGAPDNFIPTEPDPEKEARVSEFLADKGFQVVMKNNKTAPAEVLEKQMEEMKRREEMIRREQMDQMEEMEKMKQQLAALKNEERVPQSDG